MIGATGVAVSGMAGCGDDPSAPFSGGRVTDHPVGVWKLYGGPRFIVGRDAGGFFAFSAVCTHQSATLDFREPTACAGSAGCTSASTTGLTECPLHFSRFDQNGGLIRGPATRALAHFQVTITSGEITVNPSASVAADARTTGV